MLLGRRLVARESESAMTREKTEPVMGEALRFFVFLYRISGPGVEGGEKGGGERKRLVEKKGIPSMVANGMMGQRESRRRRADAGRREPRGEWDEKFSLASLRCLYTRGSCMAMGHISVLRERGAPPKNQIECKNRINSSCKLESYVRPAGSLSKLSLFLFLLFPLFLSVSSLSHTLFTLSPADPFLFLSRPAPSFSSLQPGLQARSHDSTSRGKADHLPYFLLFYLSAGMRVMRLAGLMKDPLFIDK